MTDLDDDGFNDETFKGFGEEPKQPDPATPPATDPPAPVVPPPAAAVELPKEEPKPAEEPKKSEEADKTPKAPEVTTPAAEDDKKTEESPKPPEAPAAPPEPVAPEPSQPLTKDDVKEVVSNLLNTERASGKELETSTQEVIEKYYPEGLSSTLIDESTGKPLKTPEDVMAVSDMNADQAAQWLINEQYKLDSQLTQIKEDARKIAETTVNFKRESIAAVEKYAPLFEAYPTLQKKTFDKLLKLTKYDEKKGVVLSSPDVMEFYDDALEPYQLAFEHSTKQSATAPVTPTKPEPPKPSAEDRFDESGDGGTSAPSDDPTDFAQQVSKELAKGI